MFLPVLFLGIFVGKVEALDQSGIHIAGGDHGLVGGEDETAAGSTGVDDPLDVILDILEFLHSGIGRLQAAHQDLMVTQKCMGLQEVIIVNMEHHRILGQFQEAVPDIFPTAFQNDVLLAALGVDPFDQFLFIGPVQLLVLLGA